MLFARNNLTRRTPQFTNTKSVRSFSDKVQFNHKPFVSPIADVNGLDYTKENLYIETRKEISEATTLLPASYRSLSFYEVEKKNIWSKSWVCVGFTHQVKNPGDTFLCTVADQSLFVTRTKAGNLRAFYNVCRHRGSQIVLKDGRYEVFRCPYHSWGYSPDGKLLGTPLFTPKDDPFLQKQTEALCIAPKNFDKKDYGLFPVHVDTWGGMIMVNLDKNPMPLKEFLGDLPQRYANYPLDELEVARVKVYRMKCNWKLVAENFMEYYHLPWVHPELCTVSGVDEHKRYQGPGMYTGFCTSPLSDGGTPLDAPYFPPMSEKLTPVEKKSSYFITLFPNISWFLFPHHLATLLVFPKGPLETEELLTIAVHPSLYKKDPDAEKKLDKMLEFYDMVNVQDVEAIERVMSGVGCTPYKGGRMTYRFEEPIHRFQNMIIDYVTGKPRVPPGDN
eukprot:TRINITY_DN428_c0_g1_i1.p1 TRINITY_DN428_c0_g1~~TRINITY_DN428_c0_g1_i1.p1  ORF type:complete len:447 (-),score=100.10 TRINITY_DN428_c0_g1_i1:136-1476(-)